MFREFIASQFKKPTGLFGLFSHRVMVKNNQKNYDRLIKDLDIQPKDKLLEIGFGPGIGIHMITEICSNCTIHGIDFSMLMYRKASEYNKQYINTGRVHLQHGDFLTVPFVENDYDKIFCLNVVYFWNDLSTPFKKVFSILKKGGSFYIFMATKDTLEEKRAPDNVFSKYSIEQVVEVLNAAGFNTVKYYLDKGYYINAKK